MERPFGETLGRWSLRIDAAYCALLGLAVVIWSRGIADGIGYSAVFLAVVGIAVVLWSGALLWLQRRFPLRSALQFVFVANTAATLAVACAIPAASTAVGKISIAVIAVDIALFAVSQAVALRLLRSRVVSRAKITS